VKNIYLCFMMKDEQRDQVTKAVAWRVETLRSLGGIRCCSISDSTVCNPYDLYMLYELDSERFSLFSMDILIRRNSLN